MKFVLFIKTHLLLVGSTIIVGISGFLFTSILIMQMSTEEVINILEAGADTVPIIKNEDLDELGKTYSILNEQFEREINELTMGKANRHNKMDKELNYYGVSGRDNEVLKNDEYINGIRIQYKKNNESVNSGDSNFNDIISVMSVLFEQKMDTKNIDELKEILTELFWLSHTYTFDSDELYSCKYGCIAENNYKCTSVYNEYKNTKYLKYELLQVPYHEEYIDYGYDEKENFRVVVPKHSCIVHGGKGAGCIWDENKICYHGTSLQNFTECDKKIKIPNEINSENGKIIEDSGDEISYSEVGVDVIPDDIDAMYLQLEPKSGQKVLRTDTNCRYYKIVKLCKTRENILNDLKNKKTDLLKKEYSAMKHAESCNYSGDGECKTCKNNEDAVRKANTLVLNLQSELEWHISKVCEADEMGSKYWCDGYRLCMGHKDHYKCDGKHKIVLCSGHTNINVDIKILYNNEILEEAVKIFK